VEQDFDAQVTQVAARAVDAGAALGSTTAAALRESIRPAG